jgi:D-amino-acid dehydrogenase
MLAALNDQALEAYDKLARAGVAANPIDKALIAAFTEPGHASHLHAGDDGEPLPLAEARTMVPLLGNQISHAVRINGTRYLQPARFVEALAASFAQRGGVIAVETVTGLDRGGQVETASGTLSADVAVIATGAAIGRLARPLGVRVPVHAGRGYSFAVATDLPNDHPIYLPHQHITCTPDEGRLRVTSTMEFGPPSAASRARRIDGIVRRASPLLTGIDWTQRTDEWSGDRPVTSDGLPIIGATRVPGVYVAGGHGMWGMTQGPASGDLLARFIATGVRPDLLTAFDPTR